MKMVYHLKYFLCFSVLIFGCSSNNDNPKLSLSVIKEFKLSGETQKYLHQIYPTVAANPVAEELAFANFRSPLGIIITDYDGGFVEKIGEEGRGPGEVQDVRYFGFDKSGNLVILDKPAAFFNLYNRSTGEARSFDYQVNKGTAVITRNLQMCEGKWLLGIYPLGELPKPTVPTIGIYDSTFNYVDSFGGYDPFFRGRKGILQETVLNIDCDQGLIYSSHAKIPFIQIYTIEEKARIGRIEHVPPSFRMSEKFITMTSSARRWSQFLAEEQSITLKIAHSRDHIYQVFRNESKEFRQHRLLNESDHFVAVYDKENRQFLGEIKIPGAVLGSTKEGYLIILKNEETFTIQLIEIFSKK